MSITGRCNGCGKFSASLEHSAQRTAYVCGCGWSFVLREVEYLPDDPRSTVDTSAVSVDDLDLYACGE